MVVAIERYLRRPSSRSPRWLGAAEFFRTILPFVMCIAVYTNLHDTVRFVNPNDIHHYLTAAEQWIFGGQPVVWAERYITPARTEFFTLFYANFYLVAPSVVLLLWFTGKRDQARHVLLGTIICFYSGYVLYVLFPAAPPRLYLESLGMFSVSLRGGPIANFQQALIEMMPNQAARAAFPSLHAGGEPAQPGLRLALLPVVLPDPAGVRRAAAGVDGLSAPSLGGGSARRRRPRALGAVDHAPVRAVVARAPPHAEPASPLRPRRRGPAARPPSPGRVPHAVAAAASRRCRSLRVSPTRLSV